LEKALSALAAEKTANDLLLEEERAMKKRLEQVGAELADAKKAQASNASELGALRQQVAALLKDNGALHDDLNGRDALLKAKDKELKDAQQKIDDLNAQLAQALAALKKLDGNNASEAELLAAKKRIAELEAELAKLKKDFQTSQAELAKLTGLNAELQSKLDNQTSRLNALSAEHAGIGDDVDDLRGQLTHAKEESNFRIAELQKLLEEALRALAYEKTANDLLVEEESGIRRQMADLVNQVQQAASEIEELTGELASTKSHNAELEKDMEAIRAKLMEKEDIILKNDIEIADLNRTVEKLMAQLDKTNKDLNAANTSLSEKESRLSDALKTIADMKKDIARLHDELQKALDELARLKAERDALQKGQMTNSSDLTALRAKIVELERQVDNLTRTLADREDALKGRELEIKGCRVKIDELTAELNLLREQLRKFQDGSFSNADMKAAKDRIADLESELARMKSLYQSVSDRLKELEEEYTSLGNNNDKLQVYIGILF
jgi:ELKS/RAB6-interacting/CAST family protein 1